MIALRFVMLLPLALSLAAPAATFTVTSTNDSGAGSLRQAILDNNATVGTTNLIQFNIPDAGVQTLRPLTEWPILTQPVVIDGFTQSGASANTLQVGNDAALKIRIDGFEIPVGRGLILGVGGCVVRGLVVVNWQQYGILFSSGSGSAIEGCFVGLEADGLTAAGNKRGIQVIGLAKGCRIGGATAAARNVISASQQTGINLASTSQILVQGNYVGTDATGLLPRGNVSAGIYGGQAHFNLIGGTNALERNILSANGAGGLDLSGHTNVIQGNFIGLNAPGSAGLGNMAYGLGLSGGTNNLVGGSQAGAGNVISSNQFHGLYLYGTTAARIQGNRIGTSADGLSAIGNGYYGIMVLDCPGLLIGGAGTGEGNQISGNGQHGIEILTGTGVRVQGNQIGTDASGLGPLGNGDNGINVDAGSHTVGGTNVGEGNIIAFNRRTGVEISISTRGNTIVGNSIHSNVSMGIELYPPSGVTPNDAGDGDAGSNDLQNYPVLSQAALLPTAVFLRGTLNSRTNRDYRLDFYGNNVCESSGYGEGKVWLGTTNVTTDGSGNAGFTNLVNVAPGISFLTATATDTNGSTSEFSACRMLNTNGVLDLVLTRILSTNLIISGQPFAYTFTLSNAGPDTATSAGMSFRFPDEVTILDAVVSQGTIGEDGPLYISFGTILPGGTATLTVTALPTAAGAFPDNSSSYSAQTDLSPGNNTVSAAVTVADGPGLLKFSGSLLTVREDDGLATVVVTRAGGAIGTVSVDFATSNLTALAGVDFVATNGTLVFTDGEFVKTFAVSIPDNSVSQCNRELWVMLSNPTGGAALGDPSAAKLLIVEDDIVRAGMVEAVSLEVNPPDPNKYASIGTVAAQGGFATFVVRGYNYAGGFNWAGFGDLYLRDITNHATTLVSATTNGLPGIYAAGTPLISSNGRFAAFYSGGPDLVTGDTNEDWDVFVRDTLVSTTRLVSVSYSGTGPGNGSSFLSDLTPDGRFVVFRSDASNLVTNDTNGTDDVFLRDLNSGVTELISVKSSGQGSGNGGSQGGSISADGRHVAFSSTASDLNGAATNGRSQIYVRDRLLGTNILCSVSTNHAPASSECFLRGISANGRGVLFSTSATNFGTGGSDNIFAFDIPTRKLQLVTVTTSGTAASSYHSEPSISADGRHVAFYSYAGNLVANDSNNQPDVFVRDLLAEVTALISVNCHGTGSGNNSSESPRLSTDGRFVVFESSATDLVPGVVPGYQYQVYRRDLLTGTTALLSFNHLTGAAGNSWNYQAVMSADAGTVAFTSWSTNLTEVDTSDRPDIYVWRAPAPAQAGINATIASLKMVDGQPVLDVRGSPGTLYLLQRALSLRPPTLWMPLGTTNAPANGQFDWIDTTAPVGPAFYRVVHP